MGRPVAAPLERELRLEGAPAKAPGLRVDARFLGGVLLSSPFALVREGRLAPDAEPNRRAAFEGTGRKKYFDFARVRPRHLREAARAGP